MIELKTKAFSDIAKEGMEEIGKGIGDKVPDFSKKIGKEIGNKVPNFTCEFRNQDGISKKTPNSNGYWTGEKGNSIWIPDDDYIPQEKYPNSEGAKSNPDNLTLKEIFKKYGIDGIEFKDGEPDFSPVSESTVEVDDFSEKRDENFAQADEKLAEQWNSEGKEGGPWTREKVEEYRKENNMTWHERSDCKTMDLVPTEIHANVPHSGGISATTNKGE